MMHNTTATYTLLFLFSIFIAHANDILPIKDAFTNNACPLIKSPNRGIDIKKVMDYKMPHIIARYSKDYSVSAEVAKIHEVELKRFLILAADDDESLDMMSIEVDNLWHTFLLFTKEYQQFCNDMFGKFIHHNPLV